MDFSVYKGLIEYIKIVVILQEELIKPDSHTSKVPMCKYLKTPLKSPIKLALNSYGPLGQFLIERSIFLTELS